MAHRAEVAIARDVGGLLQLARQSLQAAESRARVHKSHEALDSSVQRRRD
jgi:hypothetical protein